MENKNVDQTVEINDKADCEKNEVNNTQDSQDVKEAAKKNNRKEKVLEKSLQEKDKKIAELEETIKNADDKYLRMLAEYDNFRKRVQKEKESIYSDATCEAVGKLLSVLDNLERAANVDIANADAKSVVDGVVKILEQAKETFLKMGVEEIPAKDQQFNPEVHNAVMHEDNEEYGENVISEVFLKGYKMGDKVIRHSMVKVMN